VIAEVVSEAWELLDAGAEPKAALTMDGDVVVQGDRAGLFQIFRNLIENSLRHTEASGHINVSFERLESGFARVTVTDDGEGIPLKALPRVFERFYRADSSRARDVGGTGLGLAIVKHLVLSMGGEIEARSVLGQGTTVSFTIPLARERAPLD
jgi:signal transduction histidine kinase